MSLAMNQAVFATDRLALPKNGTIGFKKKYGWMDFLMALLNTNQAADILGVSPARIRQLIKEERIAAVKLGRDHVIDKQELERFQKHGRKSGPKGGRPTK